MKTLQELFDISAIHMLTQNTKSEYIDEVGDLTCAYRSISEDGIPVMCGVGCHIKDAAYSKRIEGRAYNSDLVIKALINSGIVYTSEVDKLFYDIQYVHDQFHPLDWKRELEIVAKKNSLEWNHA